MHAMAQSPSERVKGVLREDANMIQLDFTGLTGWEIKSMSVFYRIA